MWLADLSRMTRRSSSVLVSILAVAAGLAACDSLEIDGQRRGNDTPGAAPGPAMPEPVPGLECTDPAALRPSDMRRLTGAQIERTLRAALGDAAFAPLADTLALLGRDAIHRDPNDLAPTFDPSQLETIDRVSRRVGAVITASDDNLKSVAGACSTATPVDAACVTDFVTRFGRQMFRRPLAPEEVTSYADVFKAAPSGREGIADVAAAMVLAPDFLYHVELGAGQEGTPSEFELTPHEVAARVSYFLTDGPPDGALMAAADDRSIEDETVLGGHVDRLLGSDAGKAKVRSFVRYWLTLERFQGLPKAAAFLAGVDTEGLPAEMVRELDAFVDYIAYTKRGSYRDLLTSRRSFAQTPALAKILGHEVPAKPGDEVSTDDAHMGLLLRGPVLGSSTVETHPIIRGAFMARRIVCNEIPSPSAADLAGREAAQFVADPLKQSSGEMMVQRTAAESCARCHKQINPFGAVLEGFDTLGRARTTETMFDPMGAKIAEHPVVTDGTIVINGTESAAVRNAPEAMEALSKSVAAPLCFTRHVYRFYQAQRENAVDGCRLAEMFHAMQDPNGTILGNIKASIVHTSLNKRRIQ